MIAGRRIGRRTVIRFGLTTGGQGVLWALVVYLLYTVAGLEWMRVPWMPISVIGIAVSFYVGFKNNASYDRFWEGRKIWGGVVNESRTWTSAVLCYVLPGRTDEEAREVRRVLVYRHLAWANALRLQLRSTSRFFDNPASGTKKRLTRHDAHMRNDWDTELTPFLSAEELAELSPMANTATHLVHRQGEHLSKLHLDGRMDLFHQIAMMEILRELYALQGKAERIKKTPFPRQYAEYSSLFTRAFLIAVPFGLLDVFAQHIPSGIPTSENVVWLIPYFMSAFVVSWVFLTMEGIGSASEDPFERAMNDVPMNALCVVIERDVRQMLGESEIPEPESPIDNLLY